MNGAGDARPQCATIAQRVERPFRKRQVHGFDPRWWLLALVRVTERSNGGA